MAYDLGFFIALHYIPIGRIKSHCIYLTVSRNFNVENCFSNCLFLPEIICKRYSVTTIIQSLFQ